jgi:hypothetical protein
VLTTVRFSNQLVAELYQPFWTAWQGGEFLTDAAAVAGTYRHRGLRWDVTLLRTDLWGTARRYAIRCSNRCLSLRESDHSPHEVRSRRSQTTRSQRRVAASRDRHGRSAQWIGQAF